MTVEKFMFNRSFDSGQPDPAVEEVEEETVEEEPEPEIVVPTFSEEELESAKKEAFEKGRDEALKESATTVENQIVETVKNVSQKLDQLIAEQKAANRDIFRDAINVSHAVTKKMFPSLNDQQKLTEIETLLQKTLIQVLEEPRVTIEVHPDMETPLNERIADISAETHYEGKLLINSSGSIADGDCKIEWSNGGAERNLEALIAEADEIIENNLSSLDSDYVPSPDAYNEDPDKNLTGNPQESGESDTTGTEAAPPSPTQSEENTATEPPSETSTPSQPEEPETSDAETSKSDEDSGKQDDLPQISADNDADASTEDATSGGDAPEEAMTAKPTD